ncbi:uncharacterized protein LOC111359654 [Spodoptera litura]|uniref:Uncharacterized protein LOC111359654 n=1 Tax=Spodoptera litura TaxID=69820 RepID=A0A9J7EM39_SPOLT|nr:uncharacterized protein LOC111359654 [Spodoptera litura]
MSQSRGRESSAEHALRLSAQNTRSSQLHERQSSAERSQRLAENRVRNSQTRARESSAERSQRLIAQNTRSSQLHERQSSAERSQRLAENRVRNSQTRARESSAERSQRLIAQNTRSSQLHERQSSAERSQRLAENRVRNSQTRARESSAERSQRLIAQNTRSSQLHERQSSAERSQRLAENRVRNSQTRARESSAERSQRLIAQNTRSSQLHERQSSAERSQRLAENRVRNSQTRARESSAERSQRLIAQRERQHSLTIRTRNRVLAHSNRSAFSYDPQIDYAHQNSIQIGAMNKVCPRCCAKKWNDEANGMCCASGKVILPNITEPPEPIKSLLTNNHTLSAHFFNNARRYNSLFQMTSFGAKEIREGNFMPTFKVEGQVYHLIGSLLPPAGQNPQFLQIYFISEADQLSLRANMAPTLKIDLINELQTVLNSHNIYVRSFKHSIELNNPESLKLIIHSDRTPQTEHQGRYNAPSINEVAVLLVDEDKGPRDIVLHGRDGQLKRVSELHRAYDPLQYPLIYPKYDNLEEKHWRSRLLALLQLY